jgi:hypothetical protein
MKLILLATLLSSTFSSNDQMKNDIGHYRDRNLSSLTQGSSLSSPLKFEENCKLRGLFGIMPARRK